jgi:hypothetical protein
VTESIEAVLEMGGQDRSTHAMVLPYKTKGELLAGKSLHSLL